MWPVLGALAWAAHVVWPEFLILSISPSGSSAFEIARRVLGRLTHYKFYRLGTEAGRMDWLFGKGRRFLSGNHSKVFPRRYMRGVSAFGGYDGRPDFPTTQPPGQGPVNCYASPSIYTATWINAETLLKRHWFWWAPFGHRSLHCQAEGLQRPCNGVAVVYATMILVLTAHEGGIWSTYCNSECDLLGTQQG
jgi:hypothetical protein